MGFSRDARRRWLGGLSLAISAVMLVLGLTALKGRLSLRGFAVYWLACFLSTALALVFALLDLRAVRLRSQVEEIELMNRTLDGIRRDKEEKATKAGSNGEG